METKYRTREQIKEQLDSMKKAKQIAFWSDFKAYKMYSKQVIYRSQLYFKKVLEESKGRILLTKLTKVC